MDQPTNIPLAATRLTIASILLTTVMVNALPLLPYGGEGVVQDYPSSSSSSSSAPSARDPSGPPRSLQEDIAELEGLSPQEAYFLALSLLLENGDSHRARSVLNRVLAAAPSKGHVFEKRGSKRFNFGNRYEKRGRKRLDMGILGMDTYGDLMHSVMSSKQRNQGDRRRAIVEMMQQKG